MKDAYVQAIWNDHKRQAKYKNINKDMIWLG